MAGDPETGPLTSAHVSQGHMAGGPSPRQLCLGSEHSTGQRRSAGSELPPFVLEADMDKTPKAQSPSQFHHKYPDRVSGAELIVQAPAAALPETALPAVGGRGRRLGQEAQGEPEASADLH